MLTIAFAALSAAVLLGLALAAPHLGATGRIPRFVGRLGIVHGVVAGAGVATLLIAIRTAWLGEGRGPGPLGWDAAALLGAAFLAGLFLLWRIRSGRSTGGVLVLHGSLAVIGYVILAAYLSAG